MTSPYPKTNLENNLDTIFSTESIIDEDSILKRYSFEKKLISSVISGNYEQAIHTWKSFEESGDDLKDLEARIPNDPDRLQRNLTWNLNTVLRISLLLSQVPVTYIHIISSHFGMLIETLPLESIKDHSLHVNMIRIYCYTAKQFNTRQYSKNVEKIVNYIIFNLQEELTLEQIAEEFNFSPVYINRLLKKETGYTTIQYIKHQRILLAKMMLHFEDMSIAEIAGIVGYPDCSYFCRVFKQIEHVSPLQYKARIDEKEKEHWILP